MNKQIGQIGSSFESFLKDQGTLEETTEVSIKRVVVWLAGKAPLYLKTK